MTETSQPPDNEDPQEEPASEGVSMKRRHFANFGSLAVTKFLADLFTFGLFLALSRVYGPDGIGVYSFAMAVVGFFAVAAEFGLTTLMVKDLSQRTERAGSYFGNLLFARLILSVLNLSLLAVVALLLFPDPLTVQAILILGLYQILYYLLDGCLTLATAAEEMHINGLVELSLRVTITAAGIGLAVAGFPLTVVLLVFPAFTAIHLAAVFVLVTRRYVVPVFDISSDFLRAKLKEAIPYALSSFLLLVYSRVDILFLGFMVGEVAVGLYNVAYRVVFGMLIMTYYLSQALFPMASRLFKEDVDRFGALYEKGLRLAILMGVPMTAGMALVADPLILLFYGDEFATSGPILALLGGLILLGFLKNMIGMFLTAGGRQVDRTRSQVWAAITNVGLNAVLIPMFSLVGAAVATLTSETLLVLLYASQLGSLLGGLPHVGGRVVVSLLATTPFVALFLALPGQPLWVIIPASVLIYAGGLLAFPDIRRGELRVLLGILRPAAREGATSP